MKKRRGWLWVVLLVIGLITTEVISSRRVNPSGRFSNLSGYLAYRPAASDFALVDINGNTHVIAYGERSSWLLMSSGPSAYIFDDTGKLVDWSHDTGDDPAFDSKWNVQSAWSSSKLSRIAVQGMATTAPATRSLR